MSAVGLSACIFLPYQWTAKRIPLLSLTLSKSVHPCTLLDASFGRSQNIATVWNHRHPWRYWAMYLRVHCSTTSFALQKLASAWNHEHPCPFCNVHPCTLLDARFLFCKKLAQGTWRKNSRRNDYSISQGVGAFFDQLTCFIMGHDRLFIPLFLL